MGLSGENLDATTDRTIVIGTETWMIIGMIEERKRAIGEAVRNDTTTAMPIMMSMENIANTITAAREILHRR